MITLTNRSLFDALHAFAGVSPFTDGIIVFVAEYLPYLLLLAATVFLFRLSGGWRVRVAALGEMALTLILARGILATAIQFAYPVLRPFEALSFSPLFLETSSAFPSGHATAFFALAAAVVWYRRGWGRWLFFFAVLVGVARIIAGVHWPLDIVGGALVGAGSALIVHGAVKRYVETLQRGSQIAP